MGFTLPAVPGPGQRDGMAAPPPIRLAVLDLAGTTVRDDGAVEAAFIEAVRHAGVRPGTGGYDPRPGGRPGAAGVLVCLTTGFSAGTRDALLDALGWRDLVDLALSPGPGVRGRPHPDLVLAAILALGVDDVRAVAVAGDTANDLLAGTRAGASIVAGVLT